MPSEDLRSIPGLEDKYRRTLATRLSITSARELADADPDAIYTQLKNLRPRPSRARIADWQRQARSGLGDVDVDRSAWHTAASFAVIFAQRRVNGVWERRLEAEQTEVDPEPAHQEWPGWDCDPLCDWMRRQLGPLMDQAETVAGTASDTDGSLSGEPAASAGPGRADRADLRIESAAVTDATRELVLITAGDLTRIPPQDLMAPVRLSLTVRRGRPGQQVQAVAWFLRRPEPGWSPGGPVTITRSGRAEFDLSSVPPGEHRIRLLAWATDARATLAAVTLPALTFRPTAP